LPELFKITAESVPDLDDWGWDDYWDCHHWIEWYKKVKQKYGRKQARSTFLTYWNLQTIGAHGIDCRSFNKAFREFAKKEKLFDELYSGVGVIAQPIGAVTDVVSSGTKAVSNVAQSGENVSKILKWVVPGAIISGTLLLGFIVYQRYKKRN